MDPLPSNVLGPLRSVGVVVSTPLTPERTTATIEGTLRIRGPTGQPVHAGDMIEMLVDETGKGWWRPVPKSGAETTTTNV
jgi:hypothetical protein